MVPCKLCGLDTIPLGVKRGRISERTFHLHRCLRCRFGFVSDPWMDYAAIYSEDYYRGCGADPYIDYVHESSHPRKTIRVYEWTGILRNLQKLMVIRPTTRWLDFGCGQGGLLDFCHQRIPAQYFGFEQGWVHPEACKRGFPIIRHLDQLDENGPFDIITAIEVFEHLENPRDITVLLHRLLRPGGLLYFTTGNPEPHWDRFVDWEYVYPEIHLSYFAPEAMRCLLTGAGFSVEWRGYLPGHSDIIRYKILKRLGLKNQQLWEQALPWQLISRAVDARLRITRYPVAWA